MFPTRKSVRLKEYNYSENGAYFITICTKDKKQILSTITVGEDAHILPNVKLKEHGKVCEKYILNIDKVYENIKVDNYVIMPNHIHLIISINGRMWASSPTISGVIKSFKTMVTKEIKMSIFQRSFHDHIIRGDADYKKIFKYIDTNPQKWTLDRYYE